MKLLAVINGVDPGTGAALAHRFHQGGYRVSVELGAPMIVARAMVPVPTGAGRRAGLSKERPACGQILRLLL